MAQAIDRFLQGVFTMAQIEPTVLDKVDFDAAVEQSHSTLNIPPTLLRTADDVEEIRSQRAQAQAQANQTTQAQQSGDAMKAVGEGAAAVQGLENPEAVMEGLVAEQEAA